MKRNPNNGSSRREEALIKPVAQNPNGIQPQRGGMFIVTEPQTQSSSVGATWSRTCRPAGVFWCWAVVCYKHVAPTELANPKGILARTVVSELSLTPCFSRVCCAGPCVGTVLTVSFCASVPPKAETVKTVELPAAAPT